MTILGMASFILGIFGMILSFVMIGSFLCLLSIIFGLISLKNIYAEKWPAMCGIACSAVGSVIALIMAFQFYKDHPDFFTVVPKAFGIQSENRNESADNKEKMIDVDENLFSVELTISSEYADKKSQEEWDNISEQMGYKSIRLNPDGSVTYKMTRDQHRKLLEETRKSLENSLYEMIKSEDYPSFTNIKANDDFTQFTVTTTSQELSLSESLSTLAFYLYGGMYNAFAGNSVDNINVKFVNGNTGDVISEANSKDMGNDNTSKEQNRPKETASESEDNIDYSTGAMTFYTYDNNSRYCFIQPVTNTGNVPLYLKKCTLDIEDENGHLLLTESFISNCPDVISPGETGYFYNSFSTNDAVKNASSIVAVPKLEIIESDEEPIVYQISDTSITQGNFSPSVVGRITNNTREDDSLVYVQAIFYGENGNVIHITGTNIVNLLAGQTQSFEISILTSDENVSYENIANYEIIARKAHYQF